MNLMSTTEIPFNASKKQENVHIIDIVAPEVVTASFATIITCSMLSNGYVLFSFYITKYIKTVTTIFILSLAIADLLTGCVVSTFSMVHTLYPVETIGYSCELPVYIQLTCVAATSFSHLAVGMDRYMAVIYPTKSRIKISKSVVVVTGIWVISVLYSLRLIVQFNMNRHADVIFCNLLVEEKEDNFLFRTLDFSFLFVVPFIALGFMYFKISQRLWRGQTNITRSVRRKRKVVIFLASTLVLWFFSWFPFYILDIIGDAKKTSLPRNRISEVENNRVYVVLRFVFILMTLSYCFITPTVYIVFFPSIRHETKAAWVHIVRHASVAQKALTKVLGRSAVGPSSVDNEPDNKKLSVITVDSQSSGTGLTIAGNQSPGHGSLVPRRLDENNTAGTSAAAQPGGPDFEEITRGGRATLWKGGLFFSKTHASPQKTMIVSVERTQPGFVERTRVAGYGLAEQDERAPPRECPGESEPSPSEQTVMEVQVNMESVHSFPAEGSKSD